MISVMLQLKRGPLLLPDSTRSGEGGAVPDGVPGPHPNPLRDRTVLLLRLGKLLLRPERLVALDSEGSSQHDVSIFRVGFYRGPSRCTWQKQSWTHRRQEPLGNSSPHQ